MAWTTLKYVDTGQEINSEKLSQEQIDEIKTRYADTTNSDLAKKFNCSLDLINHVARYYALKKNPKKHLRNISDEAIDYVIKNFATSTNSELCEKFNFSESTLRKIAKMYNLNKDERAVKERFSKNMLGRYRKIRGGLDKKDYILTLCKECETIYEFSKKYPSLYKATNVLNLGDECFKHMRKFNHSIPQLILRQMTEYFFNTTCKYNTRKIIKPYEIDVYFEEFKLGFEYDGKGWHENNLIDKHLLCDKVGVTLITLKENSRRYLEDIKEQIKENLEKINSIIGLSISEEEIDNYNEEFKIPKMFSDEELELLRNNTKKYLIDNHKNLYVKYRKYNPDGLIFTNIKWTEETVSKELEKYSIWSEVYSKNKPLYNVVMKRFKYLKEKLFNK